MQEVTCSQMEHTTPLPAGVPLFAGVDVRSAFCHPVAQVLPEVNLGLASTVRHEDAKGVPGQVDPEVLSQVLSC